MNLLAIETSSPACTVAVCRGNPPTEIVERYAEEPREHTRLLVPMIRGALAEAELEVASIDAIVLGNGPGSFIGMRIGASLAQGLAYGRDIKVIPVSSLAAVAAEAFEVTDREIVAVAQDAHMSEVYLGVFRRGADNLPVPCGDERLQGQAPVDWPQSAASGPIVAVGAGWERYPQLFQHNKDRLESRSGLQYPRARCLLALARDREGIAPETVAPAYLRDKVAQKPA